MDPVAAERRLVEAGLLRVEDGVLRTTPRWQGAHHRALQRLLAQAQDGDDPRVPMALAVLEAMPQATDAEVAAMTARLLPVWAGEAGQGPLPAPLRASAEPHRQA